MHTRQISFELDKGSFSNTSKALFHNSVASLGHGVLRFLNSGRTERALRLTLCLIPPLLIFYYKWIDLNFGYSCAILYLIISALIPPLISSVAIVCFLLNGVLLLSMGWVTLMYVVAVSSSAAWVKIVTIVLFIVHVSLLSTCKIGKTAGLTNPASTFGVYSCVLGFFNSYPILFGDLTINIVWAFLRNAEKQYPKISKFILSALDPELGQKLLFILHSDPDKIPPFEPIPIRWKVPSVVTRINSELTYLVDEELDLLIHQDGINVQMVPGLWFIKLSWRATGKLGIIRNLYIFAGIAMGCFLLSILLPPQRYARSVLRRCIGKYFRDCFKTIYHMLHFDYIKDAMNLRFRASYLSLLVETEDSALSNSQMSAGNEMKMKCLPCVKSKQQKSLLSSCVVIPADSMQCTSLTLILVNLNSLNPLVTQSYFEFPFNNPGPGVWFSPYWNIILSNVTSVVLHSHNLQDLFISSRSSVFTESYELMSEALQLDSKDFNRHVNSDEIRAWTTQHSSELDLIVDSAYKIYRLCEVLICMKPASRGSQYDIFKQLILLLASRQKTHTEICSEVKHIFSCPIITTLSWQERVLALGAYWEIQCLFQEVPAKLSTDVDTFVKASTEHKTFRHIGNNLFFFISPIIVFFKVYLSSLIFFLMPWRWRWRKKEKWVFTRLPWYCSPFVAFCLRWIVGITFFFVLPLYCTDYRTWHIKNKSAQGFLGIEIMHLTAKIPSWTMLGFISSLQMTVEETMHRCLLRFIGMCFGSLAGLLCILILGVENRVPQIIWLAITTFAACWIGCNAKNPFLGYNVSWGYACQLFTYQQAIIVLESFVGLQEVGDLFLSRMVSQVLGIGTAYIISCVMFPTHFTHILAYTSRQILFSANKLFFLHLQCLNTMEIESDTTSKGRLDLGKNKLLVSSKNTILTDYKDTSKGGAFQPQSDRSVIKESTSQHNLDQLEEFLGLMEEGLATLQASYKQFSALESLHTHKLNKNVGDAAVILQLIAMRQKMFINYSFGSLKIRSKTFYVYVCDLIAEIDKLLSYVDTLLTEKSGRFSWFTGYRYSIWKYIPLVRVAPQIKVEYPILQPLIRNIFEKWKSFGTYFEDDLYVVKDVDQDGDNAPYKNFSEYLVTYALWSYIHDILKYVSTITCQ